jgi:RNA polymerase sigma factor (sigma-70 family)
MFNRLPYKWRRKRTLVLNAREQNELMLQISQASGLDEVNEHFERLYEGVVYQMWDLFYNKYVPPLSSDDLKDIFQEAWIKVLESRKKYNAEYNAFNWIYVIKRNLVLDNFRKNKGRIEFNIDDDKVSLEIKNLIEDTRPIDVRMIDNENTAIVRKTINEISDGTEREIMERRIIRGQKLEIISKEMGIPLSSLHLMIKKSLKGLRPKIENLINS